MKIARFLGPDGPQLGVVRDDRLHGLVAAAQAAGLEWMVPVFRDIRQFLLADQPGRTTLINRILSATDTSSVPLASARLLAPAEAGARVIAHVVNYPGHDKEARVKMPEKPFFFLKASASIANPGDPIFVHPVSAKLDHEVEVAVVIGRAGRDIAVADALDHVAGYTVANDVSYRDLQMNEDFPALNQSYGKNWTQAKSLDNACPLGPYLTLTDELAEPYPLQMTCLVNGEIRQEASTAEMVWKVPQLISEISRGMTLQPGDIILTGTCAGGGLADGRFLKPGDEVLCEVERLGSLTNIVRSATQPLAAAN